MAEAMTEESEPRSGPVTDPLRVLFIDHSVGFGGSSKSLSLMLRGLSGIEAHILTAQDPEVLARWFGSARLHRFRRLCNYRNAWLLQEWLDQHGVSSWARWLMLKAYAAAELLGSFITLARIGLLTSTRRIDVLHLNNGFVPEEAFWAARLYGLPLVVHMRGMPPASLSRRMVERSRKADRVIAVSSAVKNALVPSVLDDEIVVVVHDPVDCELFERESRHRSDVRRELGIGEEDIAFGIFGRVTPWKGQREFAMACLRAMDEEATIRPVIVGDESDTTPDYLASLHTQIEASRHASRFIFTGYREEVERVYAAMDVVVHASISAEPFGMVVPEAMMAGRPVIAVAEGGPLDVVEPEVDGLLVPPRDVKALSAAMVRLAQDSELRRRMGQAGPPKVRQRFDIQSSARGVAALYRDLLEDEVPATADVVQPD